jgi:hypothetical protein
LWPQYSLPWNNFFGRVQANPFYLQNQLRNITIREVQSPISFRSVPIVDSGNGHGHDDLSVPNWVEIYPAASTEQNSSATKVFVGPYVDVGKDITGLEYQYDYAGNLIWRSDESVGSFLYLVLNLNNNNPATINFPAYVQTPSRDNETYDTCRVGNRAGNFSTLTGTITVKSTGSSCPGNNDLILCLDDAVPIGTCTATCSRKTLTNANAFYYINGNRLYIAVRIPDGGDDDESACGDSDHKYQKLHISYQAAIRVVETTTPLYKALSVLDVPFGPIV